MTTNTQDIPIKTLELFPELDNLLTRLLSSLTSEEWNLPTLAKHWTVKDIAAHLLDGNLKTLSFSRDHYFYGPATDIDSYPALVAYLNEQNSLWTNAARRLSPGVLTVLLEITGKQFSAHLKTLDPFGTALFPVAWAGQEKSQNWFHIAREYTEKFIHQQQIREAVGKQALFTRKLFYPFIDCLMFGLPYTYRNVAADTGTVVTLKVLSEIGGEWNLCKAETDWVLKKQISHSPVSTIHIYPHTAWKLFSKGISPQQAIDEVEITGDKKMGVTALHMVSVMA